MLFHVHRRSAEQSNPGMDFSLEDFCQNIDRVSALAREDIVRE